jgi:hypothetical protein
MDVHDVHYVHGADGVFSVFATSVLATWGAAAFTGALVGVQILHSRTGCPVL